MVKDDRYVREGLDGRERIVPKYFEGRASQKRPDMRPWASSYPHTPKNKGENVVILPLCCA